VTLLMKGRDARERLGEGAVACVRELASVSVLRVARIGDDRVV
jgi:hypothetical protein